MTSPHGERSISNSNDYSYYENTAKGLDNDDNDDNDDKDEYCCEFYFKYTRRASYNLLITQVAPNVSHKFQYISYQTYHSITP